MYLSYDPNDKQSASDGPSVENFSLLEDDLHYTIRFQNEGNYKATHVVIKDTISSYLNANSIKIFSSSHNVQTQINRNNEVVFRFANIELPPQSENEARNQGFVKFKVSPVGNLPDNTTILNTAYIYFENNSPIVTNITENILVEELPSTAINETLASGLQVEVFPNPYNEKLHLTSNKSRFSYTVYDVRGQMILKNESQNGYADFSIQSTGIYFLVVHDKYESKAIKIVRD